MPTSFPGGVDSFPNAATLLGQTLATADHASLHGNLGDALEAMQQYVLSGAETFGTLSVRDFGAVGDGTTDDTAAIQAALDTMDAMAGRNASGIVRVPLGCYLISAPLVIRSGQTLRGDGGWDPIVGGATTLKAAPTFSGAAVIKSYSWDHGDWSHGTVIENLSIDCAGEAPVGIAIHQMGEESLISRVLVQYATDAGYLLTGDHAVGTIFASSAWHSGNHGIRFTQHATYTVNGNAGNVRLFGFSGDYNPVHIYCDGSQRLAIAGIKSEQCAVVLQVAGTGAGGTAAAIWMSGTANSTSADDVVKITGTATPSLVLLTFQAAGYTNLINDVVGSITIPSGLLSRTPTVVTWNGSMVQHGQLALAQAQSISARNPYSLGSVMPILGWGTDATVNLNAGDANGVRIRDAAGNAIATFTNTQITLKDAEDITLGAGTGTKIGTTTAQKLGFYGATPIIRQSGVPVTVAGVHAALVNLGLIVP